METLFILMAYLTLIFLLGALTLLILLCISPTFRKHFCNDLKQNH